MSVPCALQLLSRFSAVVALGLLMSAGAIGAAPSGDFVLSSNAFSEGGPFPATYTCDGARSSPPLMWTNPPNGTQSFALLMSTQPSPNDTKWSWVLYNIPSFARGLAVNSMGVGTAGAADNGAGTSYSPPCSKGPGPKTYTFTLYALSGQPALSAAANANHGAVVTEAIRSLTLGTAILNVTATRVHAGAERPGPPDHPRRDDHEGPTTLAKERSLEDPAIAMKNCALIQASVAPYGANGVSVDCHARDYGSIASKGLPAHAMMNGITATNLQVPLETDFTGDNAWKIPLTPAIAAATTSVTDGPIGVAVNGVPIFNPCKQGGCQPGKGGGDTKLMGELDTCNGHAGRADDYHYHAAPNCLMADQAPAYWDTHPIGWALDGFAIFGFNNADGSPATRDTVCGGNTLPVPNAPVGYSYHLTEVSPYILSCLRGTPSPDLVGQGGKYTPMRPPPVTPFAVTGMSLSAAPSDGYQVLSFTAARAFTSTDDGAGEHVNAAGENRIRYKSVTGSELRSLLAQRANQGKHACWNFQFISVDHASPARSVNYCR